MLTLNKMDEKIEVSTKEPQQLINDIIDRIESNSIRTWIYHLEDKLFSHTGSQYADQFYFSYTIDEPKGILIFELHKGSNDFANSRGIEMFKRMLQSHFMYDIRIIS